MMIVIATMMITTEETKESVETVMMTMVSQWKCHHSTTTGVRSLTNSVV